MMLMANMDMRVDRAVSRYLLPEPKRLAAVRTLLLVFGALFALVASVSTVNGDWAFAALYGTLAGWVGVCMRRFLPHTDGDRDGKPTAHRRATTAASVGHDGRSLHQTQAPMCS